MPASQICTQVALDHCVEYMNRIGNNIIIDGATAEVFDRVAERRWTWEEK